MFAISVTTLVKYSDHYNPNQPLHWNNLFGDISTALTPQGAWQHDEIVSS